MSTIPANLFVNVVPGVIGAGGNALDLNGLMLTTSTRVPIGTVANFPTAAAVQSYFGPSSHEAFLAGIYFAGYSGRSAVPAAMLVVQYPQNAVSAYLRGGNLSAMTLAQLKALTGSLSIVMDGQTWTANSIDLSSAASFSAAASAIQTALEVTDPQEASFTGSIAGTNLTVTEVANGSLAVGQTVTGQGVAAGTIIEALGTGTGQDGTYTVNNTQTVTSGSMTAEATPFAVTFDSVSSAFVFTSGITGSPSAAAFATGTLSASLLLTSATGAVISQGAAAAAPGVFMDQIASLTQNWASFWTAFDPDGGSGNAQKLAFAEWTNGQSDRYAYIAWDPDQSPRTQLPATTSLGYLVNTTYEYSGTCLISEISDMGYAAFVAGSIASVNFGKPNGRVTFAYLSQSGLDADVTDATTFTNLAGNPQAQGSFGNGYNCYAAIATANANFVNFQRGTISGQYEWLDSFINQIWLTNQMQLALMTLLTTIGSIPYNPAGATLTEGALSDPLNQFVTFGGARTGVALSNQQIEEVNTRAGADIAQALIAQGYYILVGVASSQVRQSRGSPPITVFYVDGESVQAITLGSVLVQ